MNYRVPKEDSDKGALEHVCHVRIMPRAVTLVENVFVQQVGVEDSVIVLVLKEHMVRAVHNSVLARMAHTVIRSQEHVTVLLGGLVHLVKHHVRKADMDLLV